VTEIVLARYARQMILPEVGGKGQQALAAARVALVGLGGLGSPAAFYLAGAGVGTLGLIDDDTVDVSNLHRQPLHGTPDRGRPKTVSAREKLTALNPAVRVVEHALRLTVDNAAAVFGGYDLVLDGSDNFETRYTVNDAAQRRGIPLVWGAVLRWEGQIMTVRPGRSACYRCLFPEPPDPAEARSCADAGVAGPLAGLVGSWMALEALKALWGAGTALVNRLLLIDGRSGRVRERVVERRKNCPACAPGAGVSTAV
jgi:adenylyltransferase/sulfurtransferase